MEVRISLISRSTLLNGQAKVEPDGTVWEVLYPIIAEFFFHDSGRGLPVFSVPLCLSVSELFMQKVVYMR